MAKMSHVGPRGAGPGVGLQRCRRRVSIRFFYTVNEMGKSPLHTPIYRGRVEHSCGSRLENELNAPTDCAYVQGLKMIISSLRRSEGDQRLSLFGVETAYILYSSRHKNCLRFHTGLT